MSHWTKLWNRWKEIKMFGLSFFSKKIRQMKKEHTLFTMSEPIGYYPPEVDQKFAEMTGSLTNLSQTIEIKNKTIDKLKAEVAHLSDEIREINFEIQHIQIPQSNSIDEMMVLHKFSQETGKEDSIEQTGKALSHMVQKDIEKKEKNRVTQQKPKLAAPATTATVPGSSGDTPTAGRTSNKIRISAPRR